MIQVLIPEALYQSLCALETFVRRGGKLGTIDVSNPISPEDGRTVDDVLDDCIALRETG